MTLRIVLFRTEHRRRLKYPVKHAYHHLLIKLRTLLQDRRPVEVIEAEQVGAALCAPGADLRRMDLCKTLAVQIIPEHHLYFLILSLVNIPIKKIDTTKFVTNCKIMSPC